MSLLLSSICAVWFLGEAFELSDCGLALAESSISVPWLLDGSEEMSSDLGLSLLVLDTYVHSLVR